MNKKKLLILTSRNPYPNIDGGDKLRIHNLARELSLYFEITLTTLTRSKVNENIIPEIPNFYNKFYSYRLTYWNSLFNFIKTFFLTKKIPLICGVYYSSKIKSKIHKDIDTYDYVFVHLSKMHLYVDKNIKPRIIFDMCDLESLKIKSILHNKSFSFKSLFFILSKNRTQYFENNLPNYYQYVTLTSNYEVNLLKKNTSHRNVLLLMNGIDPRIVFENFDKRTILFIGNMNTLANIDAFQYFYFNIFLNSDLLNRFILKVAGKMSDNFIRKYDKHSNLILVPDFNDVSSLFCDVFVGVAPMRIGSGLQNKVLEYMSHGVPCVSTQLASSAFNVKHDFNILIVNNDNDWEVEINKLLNKETYTYISKNGINYCINSHNWKNAVTQFVNYIN